MSVISIFESEVSCLSSILDLQRSCQTQNVELSTETNKYLLYLTLKKVGPSIAQRVVSKCEWSPRFVLVLSAFHKLTLVECKNGFIWLYIRCPCTGWEHFYFGLL